jgi:hypothetical protein
MYVCRLFYIGHRMDIDNSGVTWDPRQTCKASNVDIAVLVIMLPVSLKVCVHHQFSILSAAR